MSDYCRFSPLNNDSKIMRSVKEQGPVVALLDANDLASGGYISGVYNNPNCTTSLNHAVELIGWGTQPANGSTPAINYWIMKNSWGTSWGESGFFRMKRGVNMCGINEWYYFPILTAANALPYNNTCSSG
jgi:C1A family cysteine protease